MNLFLCLELEKKLLKIRGAKNTLFELQFPESYYNKLLVCLNKQNQMVGAKKPGQEH